MRKGKIGGKILAAVIGIVIVVYMLFTIRVFGNFVHLVVTDSDGADGSGNVTVEAEM